MVFLLHVFLSYLLELVYITPIQELLEDWGCVLTKETHVYLAKKCINICKQYVNVYINQHTHCIQNTNIF